MKKGIFKGTLITLVILCGCVILFGGEVLLIDIYSTTPMEVLVETTDMHKVLSLAQKTEESELIWLASIKPFTATSTMFTFETRRGEAWRVDQLLEKSGIEHHYLSIGKGAIIKDKLGLWTQGEGLGK